MSSTRALLAVGVGAFDESIRLAQTSPGTFARRLDPKFAGPYGPYGGYTLALGVRAMLDELGPKFPHIIAVTTEFFSVPKADAQVELQVTVLRRGNTFATASCVLSEPKGAPFCALLGTFGTLSPEGPFESPSHGHYKRQPSLPPTPEEAADGFELFMEAGWGERGGGGPPFPRNFRFWTTKTHFESFTRQIEEARRSGADESVRTDLGIDLEMWVECKDGREVDCVLAASLSDMLGSLNYGIHFMRHGMSTPPNTVAPHNSISHTAHFLAPPLPNSRFLRIRPLLLMRKGKHVEYEVTLWREDGEVVCVGRQVALARPMKIQAKV